MTNKEDDEEPIEYLGITARIFFLVLGGLGIAFSVFTLSGCDMIRYFPGIPPAGVPDERDPIFQDISVAYIGLYKYNPNLEGCRDISDDIDSLSWQFTMAQICAPLATILAAVAMAMVLVDFCLCRYPCSRFLSGGLFFAAFVSQSLTTLVYTAKVCEANFVNGPYPCSPERSTWYTVVALVLFLLCSFMACCVPKPVPMVARLMAAFKNDKNDGCCALCAKKGGDEETEEEGTAQDEEAPLTPEEIHEQQTRAAVTTALTTARRGKLEEIEKELVLLEKYKEQMSEEDYTAKVAVLLAALPDPENYDLFTKTRALVILPEPEDPSSSESEDEVNEGSIDYGGEEEETKKNFMGTAAAAVSGAVTRPFKSKTPDEAPEVSKAPTDVAPEVSEAPMPVDAVES